MDKSQYVLLARDGALLMLGSPDGDYTFAWAIHQGSYREPLYRVDGWRPLRLAIQSMALSYSDYSTMSYRVIEPQTYAWRYQDLNIRKTAVFDQTLQGWIIWEHCDG